MVLQQHQRSVVGFDRPDRRTLRSDYRGTTGLFSVAVDEAGGFANFRETATKTNSLVDRLKAIELPDVDGVADDLENYLETKERAEELDAKIEQTDRLIDEIVYELYGLTEEETEIVEEAVGDD